MLPFLPLQGIGLEQTVVYFLKKKKKKIAQQFLKL